MSQRFTYSTTSSSRLLADIFTFSAKEKDLETGLSYFGSRYYSSNLSIWLSVDPQSDKYAYQSGYVYCGNNPIKVVDPNGEDEYEFDECGRLINTITNTQIDQFHIIDKDGNRISSSNTFQAYTFSINKDEEGFTLFRVLGDNAKDASTQAFVFFADNTNAEWERIETDKGVFIGSSQIDNSGRIGGTLMSWKYTINAHDHNHPRGDKVPSEADHSFATKVFEKNPEAKLNIYISPKVTGSVEVWIPYNNKSWYRKKDTKEVIAPSQN